MDRSGIILVNKNTNTKSFDVIKDLRKIFGIKKIGHTGTIDKDQSGLMVCLVNDATKQVDFLQTFEKEYIIEIIFGIDTDTEDIFGNIINKNDNVYIDVKELKIVCDSFKKEYLQTPPMYSAKKVNGQRLLHFAHNDQEIERKANKVNIYSIDILTDNDLQNEITRYNAKYFSTSDLTKIEKNYNIKLQKFYLKVSCSKGTYMRALCKDIGKELGFYATMGALVRTKNANFSLDEAFDIDDIKSKYEHNDFSLIKPSYYMKDKQVVSFGKYETIHLGHQKILKKLAEVAKDNGLQSTVLIIDDTIEKDRIFSKEQRYTYIKNCGIDNIKILSLYDDIKQWSGEYFVNEILLKQLKASTIIVGDDCSFGYNGNCKINDLKSICEKHNVEVIGVNKIKISELGDMINSNLFLLEHKNEEISSTLITKCYNDKNYDAIEKLTNRMFKRG